MKRTLLFCTFVVLALYAEAQPNYINENFDVACASSVGPPTDWLYYNPLLGTEMYGMWKCTPTDGRESTGGSPTPGIQCSGVWSSAYHLDTSYLVSPVLNFSGYSAGTHITLRFDTKTTNIHLGGELAIIESTDTLFHVDTNITGGVTPIFSNGDSSDWVTHEVDISFLVGNPYFYLAFRYTSAATTGSTWYLDNVRTVNLSLFSSNTVKEDMPLRVINPASRSRIDLAYKTNGAATYDIAICDMLGREIHRETLHLSAGSQNRSIDGLDLRPGMYLIKMSDGITHYVSKVIVQ